MPEVSKLCFVLAPIGADGTEIRRHSDQVFKHIIVPAVSRFGYQAQRADHIPYPGAITTQIIQRIIAAPLVIADLTDQNPNVFYELAIRHSSRKPLIQLMTSGQAIPFDVATERTIFYDTHDLDSVEDAKAQLSEQVQAIESGGATTENPVSLAVDFAVLRESGDPNQIELADIRETIAEMRSILGSIFKTVSQPRNILPRGYLCSILRAAGLDSPEIDSPARLERIGADLFNARSLLEQFLQHKELSSEESKQILALMDKCLDRILEITILADLAKGPENASLFISD